MQAYDLAARMATPLLSQRLKANARPSPSSQRYLRLSGLFLQPSIIGDRRLRRTRALSAVYEYGDIRLFKWLVKHKVILPRQRWHFALP